MDEFKFSQEMYPSKPIESNNNNFAQKSCIDSACDKMPEKLQNDGFDIPELRKKKDCGDDNYSDTERYLQTNEHDSKKFNNDENDVQEPMSSYSIYQVKDEYLTNDSIMLIKEKKENFEQNPNKKRSNSRYNKRNANQNKKVQELFKKRNYEDNDERGKCSRCNIL